MPITYDINKDSLYIQGIEQGIERGKEETVLKMHKADFTPEKIASILELDIAFVLKVVRKNK